MANSVVTFNPNSGSFLSAGVTILTGGGNTTNVWDALATAGGSHGTVDWAAQSSVSNTQLQEIDFTCAGFTMPANSQIRGIQLRLNAEYEAGANGTPVIQEFMSLNFSYNGSSGIQVFKNNNVTLASVNPPGGTSTDAATSPIFDLSSSHLTDVNWNAPNSGYFGNPGQVGRVVLSNPGPGNEIKMFSQTSGVLALYYNQSPTAVANIGGATGAFAITTLSPTISWTYADPEGDQQAGYLITVYTGTGTAGQVVYHSNAGAITTGTDTTFMIPAGVLRDFVTYTIGVQVSDIGSNNRLSTASTAASFVTVTARIAPTLQPAFSPQFTGTLPEPSYVWNPSSGVVSNLVCAARPNVMSLIDSGFEAPPIGSVGAWTALTGTISPTIATLYFGSGAATTKAAGGTTSIISDQYVCGGGVVYMGMLHVTTAGNASSAAFSLKFYNATGTLLATSTRTCPLSGTASRWHKLFVHAEAPQGSALVSLSLVITGQTTLEVGFVDCASIVHDQINVITNSGFAQGGSLFFLTAGNTVINSGSTTTDSDNGVPNGLSMMTTTGTVGTAATFGEGSASIPTYYSTHGSKVILSASVQPVVATGGTSSVRFCLNGTGGATLPASPDFTTLAPNVWTRFSQTIDCTALATSIWETLMFGQTPTIAGVVNWDDLQLEVVWAAQNLDFESGSSTLPVSLPLGIATTGWIDSTSSLKLNSSTAASYDTTTHNSGAQSLKLNVIAKDVPASATQVFTVGGYTSLAVSWAESSSNCLSSFIFFQFFDPGGIPLIQTNNAHMTIINGLSNTSTFVPRGAVAVAVPTGSAYCRMGFTNNGSLDGINPGVCHFDTVVITPTGTLGPTPYLEGGWSAGIGIQGASALNTVLVGIQRSLDGVTFTSFARPAPGFTAAISYPVVSPSFQLNVTDYENPLGMVDSSVSQFSFYYAASSQWTDSLGNAYATPNSPVRFLVSSFFTDWWLLDPNSPADNVLVPVKTFKASVQEQSQVFNGMGRSRVTIIGDVVQGDLIDMTTITLSDATYAAILKQVRKQSVLVLRSPDGEQWYVRATKRDRERVWTGSYFTNTLRNHTLQFQEVDLIP